MNEGRKAVYTDVIMNKSRWSFGSQCLAAIQEHLHPVPVYRDEGYIEQ